LTDERGRHIVHPPAEEWLRKGKTAVKAAGKFAANWDGKLTAIG
jgi:hypothetical protein